jgi:hypothetical protein
MKSLIWVSVLVLAGIGVTSTIMTPSAFAQVTTDPSQENRQIQSIFQSQKAVNNCANTVGGGILNTAACVNTQNQGALQTASASNTNDPRDDIASASNTNGPSDPNGQSNFQLQSIVQKQWAANNCANTVVGGAFNTASCVNTQNQAAAQGASASNTNDPNDATSASNTNGPSDPNGQSNTQLQFIRQSQWAANNCANTVVGGLGNTAACVNNQNQLAVQLASAENTQ